MTDCIKSYGSERQVGDPRQQTPHALPAWTRVEGDSGRGRGYGGVGWGVASEKGMKRKGLWTTSTPPWLAVMGHAGANGGKKHTVGAAAARGRLRLRKVSRRTDRHRLDSGSLGSLGLDGQAGEAWRRGSNLQKKHHPSIKKMQLSLLAISCPPPPRQRHAHRR